jgi:hypothetical protein
MLGAHPPIAGCLAEPCYLVCRQTEGNSIVLEGGQICNCAVIFYRIGACTPPFAGDVTPRLTKNGTERSEVALVAYYSNWMGLRNARFGDNLNGGWRSGLDRRYYARMISYRLLAPYIEATFTTAAVPNQVITRESLAFRRSQCSGARRRLSTEFLLSQTTILEV